MIPFLAFALLFFGCCTADPILQESCSTVRNKMYVCVNSSVNGLPNSVNNEIEWLIFTTSNIPVLTKKHLENFPSLTDVYLKEAKLEKVEDDAFENSKALSWIDFSINNITTISPHIFSNNPDVYYFNISFNPHLIVPTDEPFLIAPQIKWLLLQGTGIKELSQTTFSKLTGLKFLSLADNELTTIPVGLFQPLNHLSSLDLSRNHFKNIFIEQSGSRTLNVYLEGNPWVCDCNLYPFMFWAKNTMKIKDEVLCSEPEVKNWNEVTKMNCPGLNITE